MTCRMLLSVGQIPMDQLLSDFQLMAQNKNEIHELNKNNPNFLHKDGWGIVLGEAGSLELYKKDCPCWEDPKFKDYRNASPDFVMLHARRASKNTPVNLESTQPFKEGEWFFCHNGTIYDFIPGKRSDSREFLSFLLERLYEAGDKEKAIRAATRRIKRYSGLNFLLSNGNETYVLNKFLEYPQYYTMKYLNNEGLAIISSEILPSFYGDWEKMPHDRIAKL